MCTCNIELVFNMGEYCVLQKLLQLDAQVLDTFGSLNKTVCALSNIENLKQGYLTTSLNQEMLQQYCAEDDAENVGGFHVLNPKSANRVL